ncbi:LysM peptidoglycan-binding domain-containing M23 family metallopeptidase [Chloroflexota bacterium]
MKRNILNLIIISLLLNSCVQTQPLDLTEHVAEGNLSNISGTRLSGRPVYDPGEIVDYIAQTGDTLEALAQHFNTSVSEIIAKNPDIPADATTMPPGMPMKIPIYYLPLWGPSFQIIPDNLFVNGPSSIVFDTDEFISSHPGWLKNYHAYAADQIRSASEIIDLVALNFSVSPQILLAVIEYKSKGLSDPTQPETEFFLEYRDYDHEGLYLQLVWAANLLNNGYYSWRTGHIKSFEHPDGTLERPDPWQNAATVAIQGFFLDESMESYQLAIGPDGIFKIFSELFGDPWDLADPHIPVSLQQPFFKLPFPPGESWTYTGGPHSGWGTLEPYAGIDFAPPLTEGGCTPTDLWTTAIANGEIVRSETGIVVLDLDGDGDERTGWNIFYLHIGTDGRISQGELVKQGDRIGHPSCEGGRTTGTHIHIARKYNGEWIPASGTLAFNLEGWVAHDGAMPYLGTLTKGSETIIACDCSNLASRITAGE